ncbi:hypothetical protein Tco_1538275 [Tanacetum coccineum]
MQVNSDDEDVDHVYYETGELMANETVVLIKNYAIRVYFGFYSIWLNSNIPIELKISKRCLANLFLWIPSPNHNRKTLYRSSYRKVVDAPPKEERSSLKAKLLKVRCVTASSIIPEKDTLQTPRWFPTDQQLQIGKQLIDLQLK